MQNKKNTFRNRRRWRQRKKRPPGTPQRSQKSYTILISTGEASGDLYGARLANQLWRNNRHLRIIGMGGERMEKAGVKILFDNRKLGVMGLVEVLFRWNVVAKAFQTFSTNLRSGKIDLLVLIDSPDFNLRIAKVAKEMKIPVVYYVGPKVWAWRPKRVDTISQLVDRMLVIFPFEESIYRQAGVRCSFVGHPLLDEIPQDQDPIFLRKLYGSDPQHLTVALLPGSRPQEVQRILPIMLSAAGFVSKKLGDVSFLIPIASSIDRLSIDREVERTSLSIKLVSGDAASVLACSDAAVVTSGTATLEAALVGTPMVVVYRMSWLTYILGRWLVKLKHVGLVNIIAGREVVPELLQGAATGKKIGLELVRLLTEWDFRKSIKKDYEEIVNKLGESGATFRSSREILDVLSEQEALKEKIGMEDRIPIEKTENVR